jgi:hypothetical protein
MEAVVVRRELETAGRGGVNLGTVAQPVAPSLGERQAAQRHRQGEPRVRFGRVDRDGPPGVARGGEVERIADAARRVGHLLAPLGGRDGRAPGGLEVQGIPVEDLPEQAQRGLGIPGRLHSTPLHDVGDLTRRGPRPEHREDCRHQRPAHAGEIHRPGPRGNR